MLEIGKTYRTTRKKNFKDPVIDGKPNFYFETNVNDQKSFAPRRGITDFSPVVGPNGKSRVPLVVLLSETDEKGVNYNPWHDEFYPDRGMIKYYGDNKPGAKEGNNKLLIKQFHCNSIANEYTRQNESVPIFCFEQVEKGLNKYQGFGIVESVELVTQYSEEYDQYFPNYLFTICVFSVAAEDEKLDWRWITDRCNPDLNNSDADRNAPKSWRWEQAPAAILSPWLKRGWM